MEKFLRLLFGPHFGRLQVRDACLEHC